MKTLSEIALKPKDRDAIETAARLLRDHFPVEGVILYGSKASGTDAEESDIDLLLLTTREVSWRERDAITDTLFDIELTHGVVISTLVVSTAEWTTGRFAVLPIHDEVDHYGVAA